MYHDITEFSIRDGLTASYDVKDKSIILRVTKRRGRHTDVLAVSTLTEYKELGPLECYCEGTVTSEGISLADFQVLFDDLRFYVAWFRRSYDGLLCPLAVNETYLKNRYGSRRGLDEQTKRLRELEFYPFRHE